jgi:hypothetical protein
VKKCALKIEFPDERLREAFATWLCESGEQAYFEWLQDFQDAEPGEAPRVLLDYHDGCWDEYGEIEEHPVIKVKVVK